MIRPPILALLLAGLAACGPTTRSVALKAAPALPPAPVFAQLPLRAALVCPTALKQFRAIGSAPSYTEDRVRIVTDYDLDFGDFHCRLFEGLLRSAFVAVRAVDDERDVAGDVEVILLPRVEKAAYGNGADIHYALRVQHRDGREITTVRGAGVTPAYKPQERWLDLAVRDAAAEVLVRLADDEAIAAMLASKGSGSANRPGGHST